MRKYVCVMHVLALISPGYALAASSGFTGDCDACLQYLSCVSQKVITDVSKMGCDQITSGSSNALRNYDVSAAVNACKSLYPAMRDADSFGILARNASLDYLYDTCFPEAVLSDTNRYIAENFIYDCAAVGYCVCNQGYYIQPRNINAGQWATNSVCNKCPTGGTTEEINAVFLEKCYKTDSAFADSTGSGKYTDRCNASFDSEEEYLNSWL